MGLDSDIFLEEVADDLRCSICLEVYEQPIQITTCKHTFCANCIRKWMEKCDEEPTCPHDRRRISKYVLRQAPKVLKKQISQLPVRCGFRGNGCYAVLKLGELKHHNHNCEYNPKNCKKVGHWLKWGEHKFEAKTNYVYLTTLPSLYSYSYSTVVSNRY